MRIAAEEHLKLRIEEVPQLAFLFFLLGEFFGGPIGQEDREQAFAVSIELLVIKLRPDARSHEEGDAAAALDIVFQILGPSFIQLRNIKEENAGILLQVGPS